MVRPKNLEWTFSEARKSCRPLRQPSGSCRTWSQYLQPRTSTNTRESVHIDNFGIGMEDPQLRVFAPQQLGG
jgi:hypothetical protein